MEGGKVNELHRLQITATGKSHAKTLSWAINQMRLLNDCTSIASVTLLGKRYIVT